MSNYLDKKPWPTEDELAVLEIYGKRFVFFLDDGSPVYSGDVLWHPDEERYGWYLKAEFKSEGMVTATMRSHNGAVPTVNISDLRWKPPTLKYCSECGQALPRIRA